MGKAIGYDMQTYPIPNKSTHLEQGVKVRAGARCDANDKGCLTLFRKLIWGEEACATIGRIGIEMEAIARKYYPRASMGRTLCWNRHGGGTYFYLEVRIDVIDGKRVENKAAGL